MYFTSLERRRNRETGRAFGVVSDSRCESIFRISNFDYGFAGLGFKEEFDAAVGRTSE